MISMVNYNHCMYRNKQFYVLRCLYTASFNFLFTLWECRKIRLACLSNLVGLCVDIDLLGVPLLYFYSFFRGFRKQYSLKILCSFKHDLLFYLFILILIILNISLFVVVDRRVSYYNIEFCVVIAFYI
ncbi:hypothetical protein EDEG_03487 [Edhazardia aedis USNM 41457]|uniref:Uncharacterized protein n=1 Tax=Edhazardia aedis (strain USNM 41457) TaxID=1003232 RepID=J8ZQW4_EDHAE|nr:hypothetical protein EDEG_03487 [Edhazardia aedis USNM 41457]|eukprot:EJW02063.1 hypothetical protein EDEG_03487 [Edhazardia aedis USNM 41457]